MCSSDQGRSTYFPPLINEMVPNKGGGEKQNHCFFSWGGGGGEAICVQKFVYTHLCTEKTRENKPKAKKKRTNATKTSEKRANKPENNKNKAKRELWRLICVQNQLCTLKFCTQTFVYKRLCTSFPPMKSEIGPGKKTMSSMPTTPSPAEFGLFASLVVKMMLYS